MTADPWAWWPAARIASASGCPVGNVSEHWPRVFAQMGACAIASPQVGVGIIGTTSIEGASSFEPVREGCYLGEPEPAETHRKTLPYYPFYGRGHIQLTHESNYDRYGQKVAALWGASPSDPAFDLVARPDNALDPDIAAAVISLYFRDTRARPSASYPEGYTLVQACESRDWEWVRRLVYGGADPTGAQRLAQIEADLGPPGGARVPIGETPVYDATAPAIAQNDNWSCAPTSTRWALTAWGRSPSEAWVESSMLSEGVVSTDDGLLQSSGADLALWVTRHYGEFGYRGEHDPLVSFDDVAHEARAGKHPLAMGGRGWYHWTGVRGYADGLLRLANPAPGWKGINQTLSREQFEMLGSFSLVRVMQPAAEAGEPIPPPDPSDPYAPWRGHIGSGILSAMEVDGALPAQSRSTWLPLGRTPADVETCYGQNGVLYYYLLTTGRGYRQGPS